MIYDYIKVYTKHKYLSKIIKTSADMTCDFPSAKTIDDKDYRKIIDMLCKEQNSISSTMNSRYTDMMEYYTLWVHQIKTPIASMRLNLQNEDSPLSRQLFSDLIRVEQYVEMVLTFLRLESDSTDYIFREYCLDDIIKQAVKKFSGEFIVRKISLDYSSAGQNVITDEKWLLFVIEQVLSNALKYTQKGQIKIYTEDCDTLCISDTGIGIAPEDLPRIFEKGYTGFNGRSDKKASGIGLYLCKKICNNLGIDITAESKVNKGTTIKMKFTQDKNTLHE